MIGGNAKLLAAAELNRYAKSIALLKLSFFSRDLASKN